MNAGEWNEVLTLAITVGGLLVLWFKWGKTAVLAVIAWAAEARRTRKDRREKWDAMLADHPTTRDEIAQLGQWKDSMNLRMSTQDSVLKRIADQQDEMVAQLWAARRFDMQAKFQCDHTGRNMQVNDFYARTMRVGERELLDHDWKNYIDPEELPQYERDAQKAFREHRRFERTVRMRRGDNTRFLARVRIEPYPEDSEDILEGRHAVWFGSVTLLEELAG